MSQPLIPLVVLCGPTASGKTALAVSLAQALDAEVLSADSMQIYRHMSIATAKPTSAEKQGVVHHMMDFLPPACSYSVAQYLADARRTIPEIVGRGKRVLVCGGTGLYISALVDNLQFEPESQSDLRQRLLEEARTQGADALLKQLAELDPQSAAALHPNNVGRIIRALEINLKFGHTVEQHNAQSRQQPSPYRSLMIGLDFDDREALYRRIDRRVDQMLAQGLVAEATDFYKNFGGCKTAAQAIGYKELRPYLENKLPLADCVENLKRATRNYAKRQLTWFRRDKRIVWLKPDLMSENELFCKALDLCVKFYENDGKR